VGGRSGKHCKKKKMVNGEKKEETGIETLEAICGDLTVAYK